MPEPEIPVIGNCAECGEPIHANEARITDEDGTLHHVEHYEASE